jgi:predicted ferric reductase
MKYSYRKGFLWLLIYFLLALLPLLIGVLGRMPEYRGFALELGVALGFIGLGMLGLQFLFSGRIKQIAPTYGMDNILQYHREMGILAFIFILAHPIILIISEPEFLNYFSPAENLPRAFALIFVLVAVIALTVSSLWRLKFGLSYEYWRLLHGFLSLAVVFIGVVHSIQVSYYLNNLWQQFLLAIIFGGFAYLVIHTRIIRPWLSRKKPYIVKEVIAERDDCWTLSLEPAGHKGMRFRCGQFVWITLGETPFSLQQHPFTIASACNERKILLTAKASGDFTSTWKNIQPGTKAFLEGPFGSFTPEPSKNIFMVMGGIGVTPGMSFLRTMQEEKDPRQAILLYANPDWERVTFREELEEISKEINLKLVHILEEPPENWQGETGMIEFETIKKHLPEKPEDFAYYLCGPKPMQDAAELSLRDLGIDWRLIYSERFEII